MNISVTSRLITTKARNKLTNLMIDENVLYKEHSTTVFLTKSSCNYFYTVKHISSSTCCPKIQNKLFYTTLS